MCVALCCVGVRCSAFVGVLLCVGALSYVLMRVECVCVCVWCVSFVVVRRCVCVACLVVWCCCGVGGVV